MHFKEIEDDEDSEFMLIGKAMAKWELAHSMNIIEFFQHTIATDLVQKGVDVLAGPSISQSLQSHVDRGNDMPEPSVSRFVRSFEKLDVSPLVICKICDFLSAYALNMPFDVHKLDAITTH